MSDQENITNNLENDNESDNETDTDTESDNETDWKDKYYESLQTIANMKLKFECSKWKYKYHYKDAEILNIEKDFKDKELEVKEGNIQDLLNILDQKDDKIKFLNKIISLLLCL